VRTWAAGRKCAHPKRAGTPTRFEYLKAVTNYFNIFMLNWGGSEDRLGSLFSRWRLLFYFLRLAISLNPARISPIQSINTLLYNLQLLFTTISFT
jgi:hypothetical protein